MRILATAAFAFAAGVFSTQVLPEGGWLPLGLAALAAAVLCALLRRSAARPERKRRRVLLRAALIFGGAALGLVCGGLTLFVAVWAMQRFGWLLTPELIDNTTLLKFFATQTPLGLLAAL